MHSQTLFEAFKLFPGGLDTKHRSRCTRHGVGQNLVEERRRIHLWHKAQRTRWASSCETYSSLRRCWARSSSARLRFVGGSTILPSSPFPRSIFETTLGRFFFCPPSSSAKWWAPGIPPISACVGAMLLASSQETLRSGGSGAHSIDAARLGQKTKKKGVYHKLPKETNNTHNGSPPFLKNTSVSSVRFMIVE